MNAKMPELRKCLERAGFGEVKTVLSSGNVAFNARPAGVGSLERKVENAMEKGLGRTFLTSDRSMLSGRSSSPTPTGPSGYLRARSGSSPSSAGRQ